MDLLTILEKTISPDTQELEAAQRFLEQAAQHNLPELMKALSDILKHGANSFVARVQAGLQLKNTIYSKDELVRANYQQRWLNFPVDVRDYIKQNILDSLGTETYRPSSAALCVACVACAEIPLGLWPQLILCLMQNITNCASTEMLKESTLEAIGYICQDINPMALKPQIDMILTAIVHGMRKEEPSNLVRFAATNALLNSLEFTKNNFEKDAERHFIMQVVCEATQSSDARVKVASMQCLVRIMSLFYKYMKEYMGQALFPITIEAMESPMDEIALQGIEFWSTVCDVEMDLAFELAEAVDQGKPPERASMFYVKGALEHLVPLILVRLTKQEEYDNDNWNPCKAASVCLMLMSNCCEDDIVQYVLPFINGNITNENWRLRDAAVMAFGSIVEGPDPEKLKPVAEQAMPMLIDLMSDGNVSVRDTTAWTLGRICDNLPNVGINENFLRPLVTVLIKGLVGESRVASNVCWALSSISEAAYDSAATPDNCDPVTYRLSAYFEVIIHRLLDATDRPDGNQHNLRSAAYEALMEFVKNSPKDCYAVVQKTTMIILERLEQVLRMETAVRSNCDRVQFNDLQSMLCATLQSLVRKMTPEDAHQIADQMMTSMLTMFRTKAGFVQEDTLVAISTLCEAMGDKFEKYMDALKPYLLMSLKSDDDYQVCVAAVGLVGDLCHSLGLRIQPHCNDLMTVMLENLRSENVHRSVKSHILSAFGDIAMAIGIHFEPYLPIVLNILHQASEVEVDRNDYDMVDYLTELRDRCLEAYTGIIQGLRIGHGCTQDDISVMILKQHVPQMLAFIDIISKDKDKSDSNIAACCGLMGDLCTAFPSECMIVMTEKDTVQGLLTKGRTSRVEKTRSLASWAVKQIHKMKNAPCTSDCHCGKCDRWTLEDLKNLGLVGSLRLVEQKKAPARRGVHK